MGEKRLLSKMVPVDMYDELMAMLEREIFMKDEYYVAIYEEINNNPKATLGQIIYSLKMKGITPSKTRVEQIAKTFGLKYKKG